MMEPAKPNFWKERRESLKKTQYAVSVELGVSPAAVWAWENDRSTPGIRLAPKLADAYGVTVKKIRDVLYAIAQAKEAAGAK